MTQWNFDAGEGFEEDLHPLVLKILQNDSFMKAALIYHLQTLDIVQFLNI